MSKETIEMLILSGPFDVPEKNGWLAVSVEFAYQHPEYTYHEYLEDNAEYGLDPFTLVDDLDKCTKTGSYFLRDKLVNRGFLVYMQPPNIGYYQNRISELNDMVKEYHRAFMEGDIPRHFIDPINQAAGIRLPVNPDGSVG